MTKKHFIALADQLKSERAHFVTYHGEEAFTAMVDFCVDFCKWQNSRFNSQIFRGYVNGECGPSGGAINAWRQPQF